MPVKDLLRGATAVKDGSEIDVDAQLVKSVQGTVRGSGAVSATLEVDARNGDHEWINIATITLSGTDATSDGITIEAAYTKMRGRCTAISGTDAVVDLSVGM